MSDDPNLAVAQRTSSPPVGRTGITFQNMDELFRFAKAVSLSGLAPKGLEKPEAIFVAVQLGLELGLSPMAALQNIGVINGRPGIYGDAALALVRASGLLKKYVEKPVGKEGTDDFGYYAKAEREGSDEPTEWTFTVRDAKLAQLWGKGGPWTQYPKRMLMWRARGFCLRDAFGDVLKGLKSMEELSDYPATEVDSTVKPMTVLEAPKPNAAPKQEPPTGKLEKGAPKPPDKLESGKPSKPEEPPGNLHLLRVKIAEAGLTEADFFKWAHHIEDAAFRIGHSINTLDEWEETAADEIQHYLSLWEVIKDQIKQQKAQAAPVLKGGKAMQETLV